MSLGDLSTLLVWGAATAFTIALIAHSTALARLAEASSHEHRRATPASLGRQVGDRSAGRSTAGDVTAVAVTETHPPGEEQVVVASWRSSGIARSTTLLGVALLLVGIVLRGLASGRWPTANMYEFTLVGVLVAVLVHVVVQRGRPIPFLGVVVTGMSVLALVLALNAFYLRADQVQPALQDYWLVIHVGVAITATGIFTVAFATSLLQVLQDTRQTERSHPTRPWRAGDGLRRRLARWRMTGPAWSWLGTVPPARQLEALSFRLNAVGFVLWTLTLIGGAIWAEQAWGRYWGWDPKEVATFVAWVVYAAYLHARTTRGWAGRRVAYFVFVGYAVVLANFTVVNLFIAGKHSYSGI